MVSWPAARMQRPTADRRSLSRKTATSRALQGFASSRAVSAMSAARRDSCRPSSPGGLSARPAAGGAGSSSNSTAGGRGSSGLRAPASSSRRPASWVAVPWDASTSMRGGGGSSAACEVGVSRAGEVSRGPSSRSPSGASSAASSSSWGAPCGGHWSHGLGRQKRQTVHQSRAGPSGGWPPVGGAQASARSWAWAVMGLPAGAWGRDAGASGALARAC